MAIMALGMAFMALRKLFKLRKKLLVLLYNYVVQHMYQAYRYIV